MMISSAAARRVFLLAKGRGSPLSASRHLSSVSQTPVSSNTIKKTAEANIEHHERNVHSSARQEQEAAIYTSNIVEDSAIDDKEETAVSPLVDRFIVTAEVTVSKIFPAGFGWQTASIFAENQGFAADSMNFALVTGAGDAAGVLGGHYLYYTIKKVVTGNKSINLTEELQTGTLLASAAMCSGTVWQPLVNALQGANLPFQGVFAGVWLGCGAAFYGGLRVARTLLSDRLQYIEEPTYENSKTDASLSVAIGGATGFFVGTDAAYLPQQNFLIGAVGIPDGTPNLAGCAIAGTSTAMGFTTAQTSLNFLYPAGKCWND